MPTPKNAPRLRNLLNRNGLTDLTGQFHTEANAYNVVALILKNVKLVPRADTHLYRTEYVLSVPRADDSGIVDQITYSTLEQAKKGKRSVRAQWSTPALPNVRHSRVGIKIHEVTTETFVTRREVS